MKPSPEQIAEWRKDAEKPYHDEYGIDNDARTKHAYTLGYIRARTEQATEIAELKTWKDAVLDSLAVSCADCSIDTPPAEILKLVASINESLLSEFHKAKLAEVMPLAKFGAMSARKWTNDAYNKVIYEDLDDELIEAIVGGVFLDEGIAPNIEATITKLLKD
jgi:hypothetical protein